MSGPPQHTALTDDAYQAATALRNSLANDLLQWTLLERRLRRDGREVLTYYKSVFVRCDGLITRFDLLSAHEVCGTPELSTKFASHKRDLERVLQTMTEECEECHISTDPPAPPLPPRARAPEAAECAAAPPPTHNVGTVVAPPYPAPQSVGSDTGAASYRAKCLTTALGIRFFSVCISFSRIH
jgi:hypothetical protein